MQVSDSKPSPQTILVHKMFHTFLKGRRVCISNLLWSLLGQFGYFSIIISLVCNLQRKLVGTTLREVQYNKCCNDSDPCPSAQTPAVTSNGCVGKTAHMLSKITPLPLCQKPFTRLLPWNPTASHLSAVHLFKPASWLLWCSASSFSVIFPCLYSFILLFSTPLLYTAHVLYKSCSSNPLVFPCTEVSSHLRSPWLLFSMALPVGLARSASGIQDRAISCKNTYVMQHDLFSGLLILF